MECLEVRLLGGFEVLGDGGRVPEEAWQRRRGAGLVKVLALARGHRLHRDQVIEALWPGLSYEAALANLHKAAHFARRAIGESDGVVVRGGRVSLAPGAVVETDVERSEAENGSFEEGSGKGSCLSSTRQSIVVRRRRMQTATTNGHKVVVNLTAGHEDADRVAVAFLVATAALAARKQVTMFLTKEAVRLALPGYADAVEVAGAPPVARLFQRYADSEGQLYVCSVCFTARNLNDEAIVDNARLAGAAPAVGMARRRRNGLQLLNTRPCRVAVRDHDARQTGETMSSEPGRARLSRRGFLNGG
jgi:predicted peroxiredoxin